MTSVSEANFSNIKDVLEASLLFKQVPQCMQ